MPTKTLFGSSDSPLLPKSIEAVSRRSVRREEYCSLLVSRRRLERCDDQARLRRGLFDANSHELFEICDRDLFMSQ